LHRDAELWQLRHSVTTYEDTLSMAAARQRYFSANGFDGSYSERWVTLKARPITFRFPNAAGRVRAVKLHDLHHIATGYQTTWTGEAEISAWEIASGCAHFMWAWYLNTSGMALGLAIAPRAVFRAFVRGRHTRNLYQSGDFREAILGRSVGDVRQSLGLDQPPPRPRLADRIAFTAWSIGASAFSLAPLAAIVYVIARLF
jgi:hypothetical protein